MLFCYKILISVTVIAIAACNTSSESSEDQRYFEFAHQDQEIQYSFVAATSDPNVIARVENELQKPLDQRTLHIHGDIARETKAYNDDWSWHFIPDEWDLVEISAEVCDGRPDMVENNLEYWVDQVGFFCPWSSRVVGEVQPDQ